MPIIHKFVFTKTEDSDPRTWDEWFAELTKEEQAEFHEATERQLAYREAAIAEGKMIKSEGTYIWKDRETATINKPQDEIWGKYFNRYLAETKTIFTVEEEEC